jgi:O-antigen/teichoic acid export membrane protein
MVGFYFGSGFLAAHLLGGSAYEPLLRIFAFDVFLSMGLIQVLSAALLGLRMFRETALVGLLVGGVLRQLLALSLIVVTDSLVGMVAGWLISDLVLTGIYFFMVARVLGPPRFNFPLRKLLRFYLPLEFAQAVNFTQAWFDRGLLVMYASLATLGIYNAAVTAFAALGGIGIALQSMLFPAFSSMRDGKDSFSMRDSVRLGVRYTNFVLVPLAFGLFATATPTLTLFAGKAYELGSTPLSILSLGFALAAFQVALAPVYLALEETVAAAAITGATAVTGMAAGYAVFPVWGVVGVSSARAGSMVLSAFLAVLVLRRKMPLDIDVRTVAKTLASGAVMAVALRAVQLLHYSKFLLPVYVLVGAAVYVVMLRLLRVVNRDDVNLLRRFLGKRLSPVCNVLSWMLLAE